MSGLYRQRLSEPVVAADTGGRSWRGVLLEATRVDFRTEVYEPPFDSVLFGYRCAAGLPSARWRGFAVARARRPTVLRPRRRMEGGRQAWPRMAGRGARQGATSTAQPVRRRHLSSVRELRRQGLSGAYEGVATTAGQGRLRQLGRDGAAHALPRRSLRCRGLSVRVPGGQGAVRPPFGPRAQPGRERR